MDLEKRVTNLEDKVDSLIKKIDRDKMYSNADVNGLRVGVANVTPYTETKTAYIGDTEAVFTYSGAGCLSVYVMDNNGEVPAHSIKRTQDFIEVAFDEPLEEVTTVTISIN